LKEFSEVSEMFKTDSVMKAENNKVDLHTSIEEENGDGQNSSGISVVESEDKKSESM
jgi:hypothetical protein